MLGPKLESMRLADPQRKPAWLRRRFARKLFSRRDYGHHCCGHCVYTAFPGSIWTRPSLACCRSIHASSHATTMSLAGESDLLRTGDKCGRNRGDEQPHAHLIPRIGSCRTVPKRDMLDHVHRVGLIKRRLGRLSAARIAERRRPTTVSIRCLNSEPLGVIRFRIAERRRAGHHLGNEPPRRRAER